MESENVVVNDSTSKGTNMSYFIALVCRSSTKWKIQFFFLLEDLVYFSTRNVCKNILKKQIVQTVL